MAEEYPGNSNKARESSLIREPVEQAPVVQEHKPHPQVSQRRKISPVREVIAAIFPGGFEEAKERLIWDIFVPWAQDMLRSGWQGLGDVIFPGSQGRATEKSQPPERYSYNSRYRIDTVSYPTPSPYGNEYYDEMRPFPTRDEAENALRDLRDIWMRYRVVTLLDFNERVGNPTRPTQDNYGWLSLDTARIERSRGGWVISMPRAVAIDNTRG